MSKKSKKSKKTSQLVQSGAGWLEEQSAQNNGSFSSRDGEGFLLLNPKKNEITKRASKKTIFRKPTAEEWPGTTESVAANKIVANISDEYDPSKLNDRLDIALDHVKFGRFEEANKAVLPELLAEGIDMFGMMTKESPKLKATLEAMKKIIVIGKSFYEYGSEYTPFVDNVVYDQLLAKYLGFGEEEPTGIVPETDKKVGITYPNLHNNMNKCYILQSGEPIPAGVKEKDSVEDFLIRSLSKLGVSSETKIKVELSPKIDGVSVNGTIKDNCLTKPQTRGDATASVYIKGMDGVEVGENTDIEGFGIQYEAFVTEEDRIKASEYLKLKQEYASCRHAAAGLVARLASGEDDELLKFISFYPIEAEGLDGTYLERMDYLDNFAVVPDDMIERTVIEGTVKELVSMIGTQFHAFELIRPKLSYAIDGMVITIVDDDYQKTIGREGRTNGYQIALKFNPAVAKAEVAGIHLDNGKKGFRTVQVDLVDPIFLDGVRYDHVPVLSANLYEQMKLRIGSIVQVNRVGDVIPSITVLEEGKGKKLPLPKKCPACGEELTIKDKKLFCENPNCSGNLAGRVQNFTETLDMDGYGESFAQMLVDKFNTDERVKNGLMVIKSIADLLELTPTKFEEVGVTTKDAQSFQEATVRALEQAPDYVVLAAVGIPGVGRQRAKDLIKIFGSYEDLVSKLDSKTLDVLLMQALGNTIGLKVYELLKGNNAYIKDIKALAPYVKNQTTFITEPAARVGHTGMEPTEEIKKICEANNFEIVDGKSFDMLIAANPTGTSGKLIKAREKGLPIFSVEDFINQYGSKK